MFDKIQLNWNSEQEWLALPLLGRRIYVNLAYDWKGSAAQNLWLNRS